MVGLRYWAEGLHHPRTAVRGNCRMGTDHEGALLAGGGVDESGTTVKGDMPETMR